MKSFKKNLFILAIFTVIIFSYNACSIFLPSIKHLEKKKPKNIILFISDGCGYYQIDAANIYQYGKTGVQVYEKFPVKFAMSTYSADGHGYSPDQAWQSFDYVKEKPTDSAAAATAIATGHKTRDGYICVDTTGQRLETIIERAEKSGKATGVVTNVMLSHGTPAGFVAHNQSRHNYLEISKEMILESAVDVIMGCGHPYYDNNGGIAADTLFVFAGGQETWQGLVAGTIGNDADGDNTADPWTLIQNRAEFQELAAGSTPKRVIGIPKARSTLQQGRGGDAVGNPYAEPLNEAVPDLAEMTAAAVNILDNDADGFFLMVEGGAVDWACHANQSGRMIEEEIDFNRAVEAAVEWVNRNSSWDETLVIVTGDHECGYLTGPGSGSVYPDSVSAGQPVWNPLVNNGKGNLPGMEWHSGKHTNSLIPLFAKGAGSEYFDFYADEQDPVRGKFIDNAELGKLLFFLYDSTDTIL